MLSGWIEHDGSPVPKHATLADEVLVRFRDGYTSKTPVHVWALAGRASNWKWNNPLVDRDNEIVEYKVMEYA